MGLGNRSHIGTKEFEKVNWLPTKERFEQMVSVNIYKFFNNDAPAYMKEIFHPVDTVHNTRRSKHWLIKPHRKNNRGQKGLSFMGPKIWNNLHSKLKTIKAIGGVFFDFFVLMYLFSKFILLSPPFYGIGKFWTVGPK